MTDDDPRRAQRRPLYLFLIITLAVGASASVFTEPNIPTWYEGLNHPAIAPPNWVFAPVWTTLYVLMAIAAWLAWKRSGLKSLEMAAFAVQLVLNFAWSLIFFSLHRIGAALVEIILLDLAILAALILFLRRNVWAGLLLVPYLGWTCFATLLTYEFWRLNT
ncbi:MAG TPA: TspO/MBR family protein [Rhizomicrobium sp.]|jgi:tryptophan-rich sensory protein